MNKADAFANNDVAFVAWQYAQRIPNCLGFAVYRTDFKTNKKVALPAWVGFQQQTNKDWKAQTTEIWPVQKFSWRDLTAARGSTYQYQIVPMVGEPGKLQPLLDSALQTNQITLTPAHGHYSAYFNRGILSTQSLAHKIPQGPQGGPNYEVLEQHIAHPGDPLRNRLAGQLIEALKSFVARAKQEGGEVYCALYELNDPELLQALLDTKDVHLVLSNTGPDDGTNKESRQTLHDAGIDITDRMLKEGHIGHNKFVVYVDKHKKPQAVLTGSTNWTFTGLCGQANNCLIIESPELAADYLDYWNRLKADDSTQGADFRAANNEVHQVQMDGDIHLWFSPNTKMQTKSAHTPAEPLDMKELFELIGTAKQGILFLVFQPGAPSIMDKVLECQQNDLTLFVRGAATDIKAVQNYDVQLYHRAGEPPDTVVAASGIKDQFSFWQKELLKASPTAHAIIHDKIVVIDPFSANCAIVTGSHNLGYKASYGNDENLIIVRGNQSLATAYAVHIMDIYDHYRWRYVLQEKGKQAWSGLGTDDKWQDKYFTIEPVQKEVQFWMSGTK